MTLEKETLKIQKAWSLDHDQLVVKIQQLKKEIERLNKELQDALVKPDALEDYYENQLKQQRKKIEDIRNKTAFSFPLDTPYGESKQQEGITNSYIDGWKSACDKILKSLLSLSEKDSVAIAEVGASGSINRRSVKGRTQQKCSVKRTALKAEGSDNRTISENNGRKKWFYYCRKCKKMHEINSQTGKNHERKYGFARVKFKIQKEVK